MKQTQNRVWPKSPQVCFLLSTTCTLQWKTWEKSAKINCIKDDMSTVNNMIPTPGTLSKCCGLGEYRSSVTKHSRCYLVCGLNPVRSFVSGVVCGAGWCWPRDAVHPWLANLRSIFWRETFCRHFCAVFCAWPIFIQFGYSLFWLFWVGRLLRGYGEVRV